ncbi:hypothetical protein BDR05DRAFT_996025 [Suillus weaverae]|nr:hypothetical protein BDR05DRAFT_996025 [Suillus weaverae]
MTTSLRQGFDTLVQLMVATQQLPSWMTLATTVHTNAAGQTIMSETTLQASALQLPLTYYGPSIPLGTDGAWTYSGLTSPAASTSSLTTSSNATSSTFTPTSSATPTSSTTPTSSYRVEESRPAGLGSPRDSGDDEADSFLRRSTTTDPERRPRPVSSLPPGDAPPHIVGSIGSDRTRSSQASTDYGVALPGSGHFGQAYSGDGIPAYASSEMLGHIMPPGELLRIGDEEELEDMPRSRMYSSSHPSLPEHIGPLLPPPPFEGTAMRKPSDRSLLNEKEKSVCSASYPTSDLEDSKVFTARCVRIQELGSRSPQDDDCTNTQLLSHCTHLHLSPALLF